MKKEIFLFKNLLLISTILFMPIFCNNAVVPSIASLKTTTDLYLWRLEGGPRELRNDSGLDYMHIQEVIGGYPEYENHTSSVIGSETSGDTNYAYDLYLALRTGTTVTLNISIYLIRSEVADDLLCSWNQTLTNTDVALYSNSSSTGDALSTQAGDYIRLSLTVCAGDGTAWKFYNHSSFYPSRITVPLTPSTIPEFQSETLFVFFVLPLTIVVLCIMFNIKIRFKKFNNL